jgi:hypothetical protein
MNSGQNGVKWRTDSPPRPSKGAGATGLATEVWCLVLRPQARRLLARTKLKTYTKQTV